MDTAEKVLVARRSIEVIKKTCEQYNISPEKISKDSRLEYEYKLWAGTQMRYIPTGVLSDEEVDVYREFDFDFGIRPLKWEEWFQIVKEYCNEHNVDTIPSGIKTEEGYELGKWLNRQIVNKKTLSPERFEKIKLIKRDLSREPKEKGIKIQYNGRIFKSATEFSKEMGIPLNIVYSGVHQGMNGRQIIEYYKRLRKQIYQGRYISYEGMEFFNTREFAEYYHIDYDYALRYFHEGYDPEIVIQYCKYGKPQKRRETPTEAPLEGRHVLYDGKDYISIKQFAEDLRIDYNKAVYYFRLDYSPEEVIHRLRWEEGELDTEEVFYAGVNYKSIRELAFYNGIPYRKLLKLLYDGNSMSKAIEILESKRTKKTIRRIVINYDGHEFENVKAFASYYGLSYQSVLLKLKSGWSYDEIVHPDKYETHKKLLVYKEKIPDEEEVIKWEKSVNTEDNLRAAKASYYGKGVEQNYEKAFGLLNRIHYLETSAKYLLALCYLYGRGTSVDAKAAIKLLEDYDRGTESSLYARDKESGMMKRVIPYLLEAYKNLLFSDYGNLEVLEKLDRFAVTFNNKDAQVYLYMYYTDINNFYRDSYEATKYMRMINDPKTIKMIHAKNPDCKLYIHEIEDASDEERSDLLMAVMDFEYLKEENKC